MVWLGSCVGSLEQKLPRANGAGHRRVDDPDLVSHPVLDLQRRGDSRLDWLGGLRRRRENPILTRDDGLRRACGSGNLGSHRRLF